MKYNNNPALEVQITLSRWSKPKTAFRIVTTTLVISAAMLIVPMGIASPTVYAANRVYAPTKVASVVLPAVGSSGSTASQPISFTSFTDSLNRINALLSGKSKELKASDLDVMANTLKQAATAAENGTLSNSNEFKDSVLKADKLVSDLYMKLPSLLGVESTTTATNRGGQTIYTPSFKFTTKFSGNVIQSLEDLGTVLETSSRSAGLGFENIKAPLITVMNENLATKVSIKDFIQLASKLHAGYMGNSIPTTQQGLLEYAKTNGILNGVSASLLKDLNQTAAVIQADAFLILGNCLPRYELEEINSEIERPFFKRGTEWESSYRDVLKLYKAGVTNLNNRSSDITTTSITYAELNDILTKLTDKSKRAKAAVVTQTVYTEVQDYYSEYIERKSFTPVAGYAKIEVRYGSHTYSAYSQAEYDFITSVVDTKIADYQKRNSGDTWKGYIACWNGTATAQQKRWVESLLSVKGISSLSFSELKQLVLALGVIGGVNADVKVTSLEGHTAYSKLHEGKASCSADAAVDSLVLDSLGFDTRVLGTDSHGFCWVRLGSEWLSMNGGLNYYGTQKRTVKRMTPSTFSNKLRSSVEIFIDGQGDD